MREDIMMKKSAAKLLLLTTLLVNVLLLSSCATAPRQPFQKIENIPDNKSLVYAYKPSGLIPLTVTMGDTAAMLYSKTYYPFIVDTGEDLKKYGSDLIVKAGQTYYLKCALKAGSGLRCTEQPAEVGQREVSQCGLAPLVYGKLKDVQGQKTKEEGPRAKEMALVHIYRANKFVSSAVSYSVGLISYNEQVDETAIRLSNASYYKWFVKPGEFGCFFIRPGSEGFSNATLSYKFDVKAGYTYYIRCHHNGMFLELIQPDVAEREIAECVKVRKDRVSEKGATEEEIAAITTPRPARLIRIIDRHGVANLVAEKRKVGVVWISQDNNNVAKLYKQGDQGLVDVIVSSAATSEVAKRFEKEKVSPYVQKYYLNVFKGAFSDEGCLTKVVDKSYSKDSLKRMKETGFFWYDLRPIAKELQVDNLMVLDMIKFGAIRKYKGFIPVTQPKGHSLVAGYLIEGTSNRLIYMKISGKTELPAGEWDSPPEFTNLMKSVESSFEKAIDEIFIAFFNRAP
jgi:hypothetical protein